jgi:hypothetical protein
MCRVHGLSEIRFSSFSSSRLDGNITPVHSFAKYFGSGVIVRARITRMRRAVDGALMTLICAHTAARDRLHPLTRAGHRGAQ